MLCEKHDVRPVDCTALDCTRLHWIVLHCTGLDCVVLFFIALYCTLLHCITLDGQYYMTLFILYFNVPHYVILGCTSVYRTVLDSTSSPVV
jgi:hypothetical protein